jgi:hypothetical protein
MKFQIMIDDSINIMSQQIGVSIFQITQNNSHVCATNDGKIFQNRIEGFSEHIAIKSYNLIIHFKATTNLLRNIDVHMVTLVYKL